MKNFKLLCLGILSLSVLASCKNKAVDFNDSVVKIQQSVVPQVEAFNKKITAVDAGTLALKDLQPDSKTLVELFDKKIAELNALAPEESGNDFKLAVIDQLKYQRNIYYKTGRLGDESLTEEERTAINTEFTNYETELRRLGERVAETQKKFAEKNNFKLEKK